MGADYANEGAGCPPPKPQLEGIWLHVYLWGIVGLALKEPDAEPLQAGCRCKATLDQNGASMARCCKDIVQAACWTCCQPACRSTAVTAAQREATDLQKERAGWQKTQKNLQSQV